MARDLAAHAGASPVCKLPAKALRGGFALVVGLLLMAVDVMSSEAGAIADFHTYTVNTARGNDVYKIRAGHHAAVVQELKAYTAFSRPWVFSTQESCHRHLAVTVWELVQVGVTGYWWDHGAATTYRNTGPNMNACSRWNEGPDPRTGHPEGHWGNYGNGILTIGGFLRREDHALQPRDPAEDERRNIICLRMQNYGFEHLACSTHLTNKTKTRDQAIHAHAIRVWLEAAFNARPIVGGDFNLNHPQGGPIPDGIREHWYISDNEAILPGRRETHQSGRMIDYQWVDRPQMLPRGTQSCIAMQSLSDHRLCIGNFRVF